MPEENEVIEEAEAVEEVNDSGDADLTDFGDGFDVFADEKETTETDKDEAISAKVVKDSGVEDKIETEVIEDPKVEPEDKVNLGFKGSYEAEKLKRQNLEIALEALKTIPQTPAKVEPKVEPEKKEEFDWTNPEKTISSLRSEMKTDVLVMKADLSESICKRNHDDYDAKYTVFEGMCKSNRSVFDEMLKQPDPAEWAYQQATKHEAMAEIGNDPAGYKDRIKAELKAELLAEMKADDNETLIKDAVTLPPSGNETPGKIVKTPPESDKPMDDVFGDR